MYRLLGHQWRGGARELLLGGDRFPETVRWRCGLYETCSSLQVSEPTNILLLQCLKLAPFHIWHVRGVSSRSSRPSGVQMRKVISPCRRNAPTSVKTIWPMTTSCCWTTGTRWRERARCFVYRSDSSLSFFTLHNSFSLRCTCGWALRPARWRSNSASRPARWVRGHTSSHFAFVFQRLPNSSSSSSSPGLHSAHALKGGRTAEEVEAGAKGKRAPLLHTLLPRLGRFQNSPRLDKRTSKSMLRRSLRIRWRRLRRTQLYLSSDSSPPRSALLNSLLTDPRPAQFYGSRGRFSL